VRDELDAGAFGDWLESMHRALRGEADADVPCAGCTACCTSAQFIHVDPDETDALAHIPRALLFPAPALPAGHLVMGYDERGACPMFVDGSCSIYAHRPRACRTYDCRVFAAAQVDPAGDGPAKQAVSERVVRWRFTYPTERDRDLHDAARAAAASSGAPRSGTATERAVIAVRDVSLGDAG
jgi:Fe-S-cluster containining protein